MRKALSWGLLAFVVFFVVTRPDDAAGVLRSTGDALKNIATGLGDFVSGLA